MRALVLAAWLLAGMKGAAIGSPASGDYDLVVVGAGPGGLVAALSAADTLRDGQRAPRILVIEKRGDLPGSRFTQDAHARAGTAFAREQILSISPDLAERIKRLGVALGDHYRGEIRVNPGSTLTSDRTGEVVYPTHTIQIGELQANLVAAARDRGIEFRFDTALDDLAPLEGDTVALSMKDKTGASSSVRARWVIGSDGSSSKSRELAGIAQTAPDRHGQMVGVWFDGPHRNVVLTPDRHNPGQAAVLVGDQHRFYGLFALARGADAPLRRAKAEGRPLSSSEERALLRHATALARKMLPTDEAKHLAAARVQPLEVSLTRAKRAVSTRHRLLLVGDALRTVNPFTGSGANSAMRDGLDAARTIGELTATTQPTDVRRLLKRYGAQVSRRTHKIQDKSRSYRYTFAPVRTRLTRSPASTARTTRAKAHSSRRPAKVSSRARTARAR